MKIRSAFFLFIYLLFATGQMGTAMAECGKPTKMVCCVDQKCCSPQSENNCCSAPSENPEPQTQHVLPTNGQFMLDIDFTKPAHQWGHTLVVEKTEKAAVKKLRAPPPEHYFILHKKLILYA